MKNKKEFLIVGLIILIAIILVALLSIDGADNKQAKEESDSSIFDNATKESANVKDSEKKDFININVDQYLEYYAADSETLILVARPTCSYCQIAEPILHNIAYEYDIDINYLNTDDFTDDDQTSFVKSDDLFETEYGTPMLLSVGKNSIKDYVNGLTDKKHYIEFLKSNNYIK